MVLENINMNESFDMLRVTCTDYCNNQVRIGYEEGLKVASQHIEMFIIVAFIGMVSYLITGMFIRKRQNDNLNGMNIVIGLNNISRMIILGMVWLLFLRIVLHIF